MARRESMAVSTHPAVLSRRDTENEPIVGDIPRDDGSGGHEGVASDGHSGQERRVRADRGAASDDDALEGVAPIDGGARVRHVREDAGRSEEDIVFDDYARIDGYVVLHLHSRADPGAGGHEDSVTQRAVSSDDGAGLHMHEMP